MKYVLECKKIAKHYPKLRLSEIDFCLEPGYILGVIGENGAGKSSLMRLILGGWQQDRLETKRIRRRQELTATADDELLEAAEGKIVVAGSDIRYHSEEAKQKLAFVMTDCPFSMFMSPLDHAKIYGISYDTWNQQVFLEKCKEYGVDVKKPLKKLSKGRCILFQLAFALAHEATLYIMDEPTGNLDVEVREIFLNVMQEIVEQGDKSIVYVTNRMEDLEQLGDYILWLHQGRQITFERKDVLLEQFMIVSGRESRFHEIKKLYPRFFLAERSFPDSREALIYAKDNRFSLPHRYPTLEELFYYHKLHMERYHESFIEHLGERV